MSKDGSHVATTLLAVAGAFAGGLALGLLIAPQSGEKSRAYLEEQAKVYGTKVADKARDVAQETLKVAKDKMNHHVGVLDNDGAWEEVGQEVKQDLDNEMRS